MDKMIDSENLSYRISWRPNSRSVNIMNNALDLNGTDLGPSVLEAEWTVVIDIPVAGVSTVIDALEKNIPLIQGPYDCCIYLREGGHQRFRALQGSHAGAEGTIQQTPASQIVFSIPTDEVLLKRVFEIVFQSHVNEEPTIRVYPAWGSRSKLLDDKDNPNRYWNRADSDQIHGQPTGTQPKGNQ